MNVAITYTEALPTIDVSLNAFKTLPMAVEQADDGGSKTGLPRAEAVVKQ